MRTLPASIFGEVQDIVENREQGLCRMPRGHRIVPLLSAQVGIH